MSKSIDFVKKRIVSGNTTYDISIADQLKEIYSLKYFEFYYPEMLDRINKKTEISNSLLKFKHRIQYDKDADFNYFTSQRALTDGTLLHLPILCKELCDRILSGYTYDSNVFKDRESYMDNDKSVAYTIGDFVVAIEDDDSFGTKEKPWLKTRITVMLPIKFEVNGKEL